jgi:WD40 repeat protein
MVSLLDLAIIAAAREEYDRQCQRAAPVLRTMQLTDFTDDILHHIFAYVSTMQDLRSFAYVNKRTHQWVFRSAATDALFGALYCHVFGQENARPDGRKSWKCLYSLRQSLAQDMNVTNPFQLNTLGILTPDREIEAVGYDHPIHFRTGQCLGYFGLERIFPKGDGPLAIWGDYDGVFLVPSLEDILPSDPYTGRRATKQFSRIPGDSQVLTVLASPMSYNEETNSSTLFLGFASGQVQAVRVVGKDGRYAYDTVSCAMAHRDEVTKLTVLPLDPPCVASSSVDGSVIVYPESVSSKPTLENAVMGCRSTDKILCMAATKWGGDKQVLLCTGDERGRLTIWSQQHMPGQARNRSLSWGGMSSMMIEDGGSLPTVIQFLHQESGILIVGTNSGGLFIFRAHLSGTLQPAVVLERIAQVPRAHVGAVDSIKIVGNVLLTSGGYEGHVIGWDSQTLMPIGSVAVHPGRLYPGIHLRKPQVLLKCAVISTVVWPEREVLVNLCRDGTVQEHSFAGVSGLEDEAYFASGAVDSDATIALDDANFVDKLTSDVVEATLSKKVTNQEPLEISSLQRVMYDADDALLGRMEMRIIQAGVQNRNNPLHPFMGADNVKYENSKMAFDLFSGLLPCMSCIDNEIGVSY